MPPILNGALMGLIFLFAVGPAFFTLIQTSIEQGFKKALFLAIGIIISDVFYVCIILFGVTEFLDNENTRFWIALVGIVVLIGYAIHSWTKKSEIKKISNIDEETSYGRSILSGFLLNGLNPFIFFYWTALISSVAINFHYQFDGQLQFFVGMISMIFALDVSKAFVSHKLKHLITPKFIKLMNRTVAIILFLFALRVIYHLINPTPL